MAKTIRATSTTTKTEIRQARKQAQAFRNARLGRQHDDSFVIEPVPFDDWTVGR